MMTADELLKMARRRRFDAMQTGNEQLAGDWSMVIRRLEQTDYALARAKTTIMTLAREIPGIPIEAAAVMRLLDAAIAGVEGG